MFLLLLSLVLPLSAQEDSVRHAPRIKRVHRPPLLLGGGDPVSASPVRLDPVLPRGEFRSAWRPVPDDKRSCSLRRPVCVAAGRQENVSLMDAALELLVNAYEEHCFGAGLPAPRVSFQRPLVWALTNSPSLSIQVGAVPSRGFDRGMTACSGGLPSRENARRCVAAASISSFAPSTSSWLRDGYSAQTSHELGAAPETNSALSDSVAYPFMGILTSSMDFVPWRTERSVSVSRLRSARFFEYLQERAVDKAGSAGWLALALGGTRTSRGASRWQAEPDIHDVLTATLGGDRARVARLFDDFAQESFFRAREQGRPLYVEWTLNGESLPRSVALSQPIQPTGSAYVLVKLTPDLYRRTLAFRMSCESPVSYVWSVARLDEHENEISRVSIPYRQRGYDAATSVETMEGTRALLLAGTNIGGVSLAHPFDPDHEPHEAHGCSVAVSVLTSGVAGVSSLEAGQE